MENPKKRIEVAVEDSLGFGDNVEAEIIKIDLETNNKEFKSFEYPATSASGEIVEETMGALGADFSGHQKEKMIEYIDVVKKSDPFIESIEISLGLKGLGFKIKKGHKTQTKHTVKRE